MPAKIGELSKELVPVINTTDWSLDVNEQNARNFEKDLRAIADFRQYLKTNGVFTGDVDSLSDEQVVKEAVSSLRWRDGNLASQAYDLYQTKVGNSPEENARRQRIQRWFQARPTMFDDLRNGNGEDFKEGLASYAGAAILDPLNLLSLGSAKAAAAAAVGAKQLAARQAGQEAAEGLLGTGVWAGARAGARTGAIEGGIGGFIGDYLSQYRDQALGLRDTTSLGEALLQGAAGGAILSAPIGGVIGGAVGAAATGKAARAADATFEAQQAAAGMQPALTQATSLTPDGGVQFQSLLNEVPTENRNVLNEALARAIVQLQERRAPLVHQVDGSPVSKDVAPEVGVLDGLIGRLQDMQRAPELVKTLSAQAEAALRAGNPEQAAALSSRAASFADSYRRFVGEEPLTADRLDELATSIFTQANATADSILRGFKTQAPAAAPAAPNPAPQAGAPAAPAATPNVNVTNAAGVTSPGVLNPDGTVTTNAADGTTVTQPGAAATSITPADPPAVAAVDGETFFTNLMGEGQPAPGTPPVVNVAQPATLANDLIPATGVDAEGKQYPAGQAAAPATPAPPAPADPAAPRSPASFAAEIAAGKRLESPEDVQFYQNNAQAIEAELERLKAAAQPTAPTTTNLADRATALQDRLNNIQAQVQALATRKGKSAEENQLLKDSRAAAKAIKDELKALQEQARREAEAAQAADAATDTPPPPPPEAAAAVAVRTDAKFDPNVDGASDNTAMQFIQSLGFSDLEADALLKYVDARATDLGRALTPEEIRGAAAEMARMRATARETAATMLNQHEDNVNAAMVQAQGMLSNDPAMLGTVQEQLVQVALQRFWDNAEVSGALLKMIASGNEARARSILLSNYPSAMVDDIMASAGRADPLKQRVDLSMTGIPNETAASMRLESERYKQRLVGAGFNNNDAQAISQAYLGGLVKEARGVLSRGEPYVVPSERGINAFAAGETAADPIKSIIGAVSSIANSLDEKSRANPDMYRFLVHGLLSGSDGVILRGLLRDGLNVTDYLNYLGGQVTAPREQIVKSLIEAGRVDALGIGRSRERVFNADVPGRIQGILRKSNIHGFTGRLDLRGTWSAEDQAISRARHAINSAFTEASPNAKLTGAMRSTPTRRQFSLTAVQDAANELAHPAITELVDRITNAIAGGRVPEVRELASMSKELEKALKEMRQKFESAIKVDRKTGDPGELMRARKDLMLAIEDMAAKSAAPVDAMQLLRVIEERAAQRRDAQRNLDMLESRYAGEIKRGQESAQRLRTELDALKADTERLSKPVGSDILTSEYAARSEASTALLEAREKAAKAPTEESKRLAAERVSDLEREIAQRGASIEGLLAQNSGALQKYNDTLKSNKARMAELSDQIKAAEKTPDDLKQARDAVRKLGERVDSLADKSPEWLDKLRDALRMNSADFDRYSRQAFVTRQMTAQLKALQNLGETTADGRLIDFERVQVARDAGGAIEDFRLEFFADPYSGNLYGARNAAATSTQLSLTVYRQAEILDAAIADMIAKGEVSPYVMDTAAGQALRTQIGGLNERTAANDMATVARQLLADKQLGVKDPDDATKVAMREFRRQLDARLDGINRRYGQPVVQKRGDAATVQDEMLLAKKVASAILQGQINHELLNARMLDVMAQAARGVPNSKVEADIKLLIEAAQQPPKAPMGSAKGVEVNFATDITATPQPDGSHLMRYKGVDVAKVGKAADGSPTLTDIQTGVVYPASRESMLKIVEPHAQRAAEQGLAVRSRIEPLKQQFVYDNALHKDAPLSSLIAPDDPAVLSRSAKELAIPETHRLAVRYQGLVYRESESVRRKGGSQNVREFLPPELRTLADADLLKQVEVGTVVTKATEGSQALLVTFRPMTEAPFQTEKRLQTPQPKRTFLSLSEAEERTITAADVAFLPAGRQQRYVGKTVKELFDQATALEVQSFGRFSTDRNGNINPAQWSASVDQIVEHLSVLHKVAPNGINLAVQSRYAAEKQLLGIFSRSSPLEIANAMATLARIKGDALPLLSAKAGDPLDAGEFGVSEMVSRVMAKRGKEQTEVLVDGKAAINLNPAFKQGVPRSFTLAHEVAHWAYFNVLSPADRGEWWRYLQRRAIGSDGGLDTEFVRMWSSLTGNTALSDALPQEVFANLFTRWLGEERAFIGGDSMWAKLIDKIRHIVNMFLGKGPAIVDPEAAAIFERFFDVSDGFKNSSALGRYKHQLVGVIKEGDASTSGLMNYFESVSALRASLAQALDSRDPFALREVLFSPRAGVSSGKGTAVADGAGVMRWLYGNLYHAPKKSAGEPSVFHSRVSIFSKTATPVDDGAGPRAPESAVSVDTLYNYLNNVNRELYDYFRNITQREGIGSVSDDMADTLSDASSAQYASVYEAMVEKMQVVDADVDQLMQLGVRTITALDKFAHSVADDIMRVSQAPVRKMMRDFNLNADGSRQNAVVQGKVARIREAQADRKRIADEALRAYQEASAAHPELEAMRGSSVFGDATYKMSPAALITEYQAAGKDSVRGREIAFELGRRVMTMPEMAGKIDGNRLAELRAEFGPKPAAAALADALVSGDRTRATELAALLSHYHNARGKPLLPLKQQFVLDAIDLELSAREGEANYVGVPASASAHVAEALVAMTHRDPKTQYALRTATYRLLNLLSSRVGRALDETTLLSAESFQRLTGRPVEGDGIMVDLRSQEFMDLRKKMRSFAMAISSSDKAPHETLIHEIAHVVRRAMFSPDDDKRMVSAFIKAVGGGEADSFRALTSAQSPDATMLRAAEEWWADGFARYLSERVSRGELANGSLELKSWHERTLDTVKEGLAYVANGLIGNKSVRQQYRQLTWFGDLFDLHSDHRVTLVTDHAESMPTSALRGFTGIFERIAPRAKINTAKAFAGLTPDQPIAEHIWGVYSYRDGVSRMVRGTDADRATLFFDTVAEKRLADMGERASDEIRAISAELSTVRAKLAFDDGLSTKLADQLRATERSLMKELHDKTGGYQLGMEVAPVVVRARNPIVFQSEEAFNAAVAQSGSFNAMVARIRETGAFDSIKIVREGGFGERFEELMVINNEDLMSLRANEGRLAKDYEAMNVREIAPDMPPLSTTALMLRGAGQLKQTVGDLSVLGTQMGLPQSMVATLRNIARGSVNGQDANRVADLSAGIQISTNSHQIRRLGGHWFADWLKPMGGAGFYERHYARMGKDAMPILEALSELPDAGNAIASWWRRATPMFAPPDFIKERLGRMGAKLPGAKSETPPSYRTIYDALIKQDLRGLSDKETEAARLISQFFDRQLKRMQQLGVMVGDVKKYDIGYVPQVWDVEAIQANRDKFRNALAQFFMADQAKFGKRLTLDEALSRAQDTIQRLTEEDGVPIPNDARATYRGGDELMRRVFNFSAADLMVLGLDDFLVKDLDSLVMHYADTTMRKIAMVERFGINNHGFDAYHSIMAGGRDAVEDLLLNSRNQNATYWRDRDGRQLTVEQPVVVAVTKFPEEAARITDHLQEIFNKYASPHDAKAEAKKALIDLYPDDATRAEFAKRADAIVNGLADFGFSGGNVSAMGHKFTGQLFDAVVNRPGAGDYAHEAVTRFSKSIRGFNSMALLGFTVLTSIPDVALSAVTSGRIGPWLKGMRDFMRLDEAGAEYRRGIRNIGTAMENIAYDRMTNLHGSSGSRRANAFFHMNLLTPWTMTMRNLSASVALQSFKTEQEIAQRLAHEGKTDSKAYRRAVRHLERFGLERYARPGAPRLDMLSVKELQDDVREGVHRFVQESIFAPTKDDIPLWAQGPWTSIMFQLKSYPLMMGRMARRSLSEAKEGNFGPLSMMVAAGMPLGAISLGLKDLVQARGGEDERSSAFRDRALKDFTGNEDMDLMLGWGMESFLQFGGLGLMADMLYSTASKLDNGSWGLFRAFGTIFGPTVTTVGETGFNVAAGVREAITEDDKNSKQRAAVRSVLNVTPFVGGLKGVREDIVDAVAGEPFKEEANPLDPRGFAPSGNNPLRPAGDWGTWLRESDTKR